MGFTISKSLASGFDAAVERTTAALKHEGFGILTDIDVKATMKAKLGIDEFPSYRILGACNPPIAHAALQAEPDIGVMLPCNVIVYEQDGRSVVSAVDAARMLSVVGNPKLESTASQVNEKLRRVIENL